MRSTLLSLLLLLSICAFAKNDLETRLTALEKALHCKNRVKPDLQNRHNAFATADYLYWLAQEDGLSYATNLTNGTKGSVENLNFQWDSGFRTGVGYRMPHDRWELFANWTHFITDADAQISSFSDYLYPEWATMVGPTSTNLVTYIDARWDLHLNLIDGEIARAFQATHCLSLRPHVGVRGAWIDQSYKTNLAGGKNGATTIYLDNIDMQNDFQGVGLRTGLDTEWTVWRCFSLFGNISGSLLYGNFQISRVEQQSNSTQIALATIIDIVDAFYQLVPTMDIALGLRFDYTFARRVALRLQAGWEFNDFFSQNKFEHLLLNENSSYSFIANDTSLTTQGLTLSARIGF
jgi:hypothetical protein